MARAGRVQWVAAYGVMLTPPAGETQPPLLSSLRVQVRKAEKYGVFVELERSHVSGLAHISQVGIPSRRGGAEGCCCIFLACCAPLLLRVCMRPRTPIVLLVMGLLLYIRLLVLHHDEQQQSHD